jgi:hypothetical protein
MLNFVKVRVILFLRLLNRSSINQFIKKTIELTPIIQLIGLVD